MLGFPVVLVKRQLITFRKFRELYREFWYPSPSRPPYSHVCQIGDPILRYNAEELNPEDIKKSEIKKVRKRNCVFIFTFLYSDSIEPSGGIC
jgi:hypothetical protein